MSILSWGKCTISHTPSVSGAPGSSATWTDIDTPKEDTTKLTPTAGNTVEATEEGGGLVDARTGKTKYQLEWYNFVKKGVERPFTDDDGIITGEHAIRVIPEDDTCEGIQIDRSTITVQEEYTPADGKLLHYIVKVLKPATGKSVKPYTVPDDSGED